MPIVISVVIVFFIIVVICFNALDKWRFRADRQYPYVRELMEEWEQVTLRLLSVCGVPAPEASVSASKHPWQAVRAANLLAQACPTPDTSNPVAGPILARQGELEEELETFVDVYNGLVKSYNKTLNRLVVRQIGRLFHWESWEELNFYPKNT